MNETKGMMLSFYTAVTRLRIAAGGRLFRIKRLPAIGATAFLLLASLWPLSAQSADPGDVEIFASTGICSDCDLAGANFDLGSYGSAMLSGASLYGTSFLGTDLSDADLSNANLNLANLQGADLSGANLSGADLSRADLTEADLTGADLTDVVTDESTTCPDASFGPCAF